MDISEFLEYHNWADAMLIDCLKQVSDDDFTSTADGVRSIRELFEHYLSSYEYLIYAGDELKAREAETKTMSREQLSSELRRSHDKFKEVVTDFTPTQQLQMWEGKTVDMDRDNYLLLYLDHLTYHRGQIMHAIKLKGYKGVNTDYYDFLEKSKYA